MAEDLAVLFHARSKAGKEFVQPMAKKGKEGSSKILANAASFFSFSISLLRSCCRVNLFLDDGDRCSGPINVESIAAAAVWKLWNDVVLVGRHVAYWVMLFFGCVECCAVAVVGQGGRRLTAFEPFKRRIYSSYFVLDSYPAPSPKPNPYFPTNMYYHQNWIS